MTEREKLKATGTYAVGYCKPPVQTRCRKGQSGNPRGRPRGMTAGRAMALLLREAYRPVTVREGEKTRTMSALQAVLRSQVALAAKGNAAAQRTVFETVQAIEGEAAAQAARARPRRGVQDGRYRLSAAWHHRGARIHSPLPTVRALARIAPPTMH